MTTISSIQVYYGFGGYFIGQLAPEGEIYSVLSDYFNSREDAEKALKQGTWTKRGRVVNIGEV